jgi:hypothetical protein
MKKFFAAILSVIMICMVMPVTVSADGTLDGGLTWTYADGTLTISGTGDMPDITPGLYPWSSNLNDITNVVIQNGVTSIGNYAFECLPSLTSVTIPDSVTSIGEQAFNTCANLNAITIPASVTTMGGRIFDGCDQVEVSLFAGSTADSYGDYDYTYITKIYIGAVINYANLGGADNSQNPIAFTYGLGVTDFASISRPGYEFLGWTPSSISNGPDIGAVTITANWREIPKEDTSVPPHLVTSNIPSGYQPVFPVITPIIEETVNFDVTAFLNSAGGVNSAKTRVEIIKAARTKGVTQITLILPENCKGISTGAIKKLLKAAGDKKLLLSYDGKIIELNEESRQFLTGENS